MSAFGARGAGFGLDAELAAKQAAKYDLEGEHRAIQWLQTITGETMVGTFGDWLKNGQVLCKAMNRIKPESIRKIETSSMPFKQMENIANFLRSSRAIGIHEADCFETADLYEAKDLGAVIRCLAALSRAAKKNVSSFTGPYLDLTVGSTIDIAREVERTEVTTSPSRPGVSVSALNQKISTMNIGECHPTVRKNPVVAMINHSLSGRAGASPATESPTAASRRPSAFESGTSSAVPAPTASSHEAVGTRGGGYGLSAEMALKQAARYDHEGERLSIQWLEAVTGIAFSGTFGSYLHDGQVLCKLINTIQPESVKKIETSTMPFKQMINISSFLRASRTLGIHESDVFETADLYEEKDLGAVIRCLHAVSRASKSIASFRGPYLELRHTVPTGVDVVPAGQGTGLGRS